jgi:hypothetical protein
MFMGMANNPFYSLMKDYCILSRTRNFVFNNYEFQSYPYVGLLNKAFMAAYIYTIAVQAEIISLILYHNSTFIIANLSKHDEISFVVGMDSSETHNYFNNIYSKVLMNSFSPSHQTMVTSWKSPF